MPNNQLDYSTSSSVYNTYSATGQHPLGFVDVATATGASFASRSLRHWLLGTRSRAIAVGWYVVRNEIG